MKERLMRGFKRVKGKKGEEGREREEERVREREMRREEREREGGGRLQRQSGKREIMLFVN